MLKFFKNGLKFKEWCDWALGYIKIWKDEKA